MGTMSGRNITEDDGVTKLLSSFKLERPRSLVQAPKWDLAVVLRFLQKEKFSRGYITKDPALYASKTVFLVLLASARRCGDVHAIDPRKVVWKERAAILTPYAGYLPKVLSAAEGRERYQPIIIRSLKSARRITDEDMKLCPLRALKAYDKWARKVSKNRKRFWISAQGRHQPVVKSTISSWVKKLIKDSHLDAALPEMAVGTCRVHELQSIAAYLSMQATFSLETILCAAQWASSSTFTTHYLRDISGLQGELMAIGPIVSGTQLIQ